MGYGDDIMATGEISFLLKNNPEAKFIIGDGSRSWWSEIFENNKSIIKANDISKYSNVIWIDNYPHHRPYRIYNQKTHFKKVAWNKSFKAKKGKIYFTKKEIIFAKNIFNKIRKSSPGKKIIHIEPNVQLKKWHSNRDWGFERWQTIVENLKHEFIFFQVSYGVQKKLRNVINLHNVNFRSSSALLSQADLFIGPHGGMAISAAALDKKAVVIFGGWCDPKNLGYNIHTNLFIKNKKSPCGSKYECKHCKKCMDLITIEMVIKEINKLLI